VALGATIVVIIGLLDDAFDLPAVVKLAGQWPRATAIVYGVV
jgi:UDP-N-acetylmuramyl pentapeptide phosphotransferase/UDP-N-acetylglucosamine-1-phosphate transferase